MFYKHVFHCVCMFQGFVWSMGGRWPVSRSQPVLSYLQERCVVGTGGLCTEGAGSMGFHLISQVRTTINPPVKQSSCFNQFLSRLQLRSDIFERKYGRTSLNLFHQINENEKEIWRGFSGVSNCRIVSPSCNRGLKKWDKTNSLITGNLTKWLLNVSCVF